MYLLLIYFYEFKPYFHKWITIQYNTYCKCNFNYINRLIDILNSYICLHILIFAVALFYLCNTTYCFTPNKNFLWLCLYFMNCLENLIVMCIFNWKMIDDDSKIKSSFWSSYIALYLNKQWITNVNKNDTIHF